MAESENAEKPTTDTDNPEQTFPPTEEATSAEASDSTLKNTDDFGQRVVDIALGAVVVTGELTIQAAKLLAEHGPELLTTLESKGRPVREKIDDWLKNSFVPPLKTERGSDGAKPKTEEPSAVEEISALERRVRELEQQVAQTPPAPPSGPVLPDLDDIEETLTSDVSPVENSTPAETVNSVASNPTDDVNNSDKEESV